MGVGAEMLPLEVLVKIFSYLPLEDLVISAQSVCKWWQQAAMEKSLWTSLTYTACGSSEETVKVLKQCPQLRSLDLISVSVNDHLIQHITDHCPNLERLNIFWDSIYNYEEVTITRPITQIKKLLLICEEELYMDFPHLKHCFPNLERLDISVLRCREKEELSLYLKEQHSLGTLGISCTTEDEGCILPCLSYAKTLKELLLNDLCEGMEMLSAKEVEHLAKITTLRINASNVSKQIAGKSIFSYFPNIETLELKGCTQSSEDILCVVAKNCPKLQKLSLPYYYQWHGEKAAVQDDTLKYAHHLEKLTHLSIQGNSFVTSKSVEYLQLIPQLTHLDLHHCESLPISSLKVVCGLSKLQVLRFDLKDSNPPNDFSASDVKNKNILILFYNCKDASSLHSLQLQHLRVGITGEPSMWV